MRKAFEKAGIKGSGGGEMKKKCIGCGKLLKDDSRFETCFECGQKKKTVSEGLPPEYITKLHNGYFDSNNCLWEEFITTFADKIAKSFKGLKTHQLRRFYGHIKAAENRLNMTGDWHSVKLDVKKLIPFVSEAKGKDKVPMSFFEFIEASIKRIDNQRDFKAFVEHFQAVVAYFTYHYPKS